MHPTLEASKQTPDECLLISTTLPTGGHSGTKQKYWFR